MSLALLCPGQGAQHPGMLMIATQSAAAADVLKAASTELGEDFGSWLQDPDLLFENARAQPLICLSQLAWWAVLRDHLPPPIAIAGYSVGELGAYAVADALNAQSLARLAHERALLMDAAARSEPGGLVALRGISPAGAAALCADKRAFVAIVIDEEACVIGGTDAALEQVKELAVRGGAVVTCLRVGVASHTPLLATAVPEFRSRLEASSLTRPLWPIVAGIDGSWVMTRDRAIGVLSEQIARMIDWSRCLDALYERRCRVFLELGPGAALSRMVLNRLPGVEARSVDEFQGSAAIVKWVAESVSRLS